MRKLYINGRLVEGRGEPMDVINPATGKVVATIHTASVEQAEEALVAAREAFKTWSFTSVDERVMWLRKLKDACLKYKDELIHEMMIEAGKSVQEATGDFGGFIMNFDFFAEEIKRVYGTVVPQCDVKRGTTMQYVYRRPLGVTVAHMAWNAVGFNLGTKLCPSLVSGCCGVFKPSSATPLFALKVGEICAEIEMPAGVVNILFGSASKIGKYLNESKIPSMISLIGSVETGREIVKQGATSVKHYSMELGGNAPCIFMPDADLDKAIPWLVARKVGSAGQGCANVNRIYVHEKLHDEFVERLLEAVKKVPNGWGEDMPPVTSGPLIDVKTRDAKIALVQRAAKEGAKLLYGGTIPENLEGCLKNGAYMVPAVLDGVTDDMEIARTELFAPIFQVLTFGDDLDDLVERCNRSEYGLASMLFTHDSRTIFKLVEELEHAEISVNLAGAGPNIPHVGMKASGTGCVRSLWSLEEYMQLRCASVNP